MDTKRKIIKKDEFFSTLAKESLAPPREKRIIRIMEAVITLSLIALFGGLPVFFTGLTWQSIAFEKLMFFYFWLLVGLVAWVVKGIAAGEMKIKRTPLDIPMIIFWLVVLLSTIFSVNRWQSLWGTFGDPSLGFLSFTALILAYYFILSNFTLSRLKWMIGALITASLIVSFWTTLIILGIRFLPAKLASFTPLSLLGSLTSSTVFFAFLLPLLIIAIFKILANEKIGKVAKILVVFILFLAIILNVFLLFALYNFVFWPGLLIGLGFLLIYFLAEIIRPPKGWFWLPTVVFVIAFTIFIIGNLNIIKANLPIEVSPTYKFSWQIAQAALKDKLILGSGPATYGYNFSLHNSPDFNLNLLYNMRFYQGKGMGAEILPTLGLAGAIAFVLGVLTFLSLGLYYLSRDKEKNKVFSLGLFTASLILLISFVFNIAGSPLILLAVLIGAAALATLFKESETEERFISLSTKSSPKYALTFAFLFILIISAVAFAFVFFSKTYLADLKAGAAARETQVSLDGSIAKLAEAIRLNNKEGRYYMRLAEEYMVLANNEMVKPEKERDINLVRQYLNNSIFAAQRGKELKPNDVLARETLAQIYDNASLYVGDALKLAEENYKKAQELEPQNPNFDLRLGLIKTMAASLEKIENRKSLVEEAKSYFNKAISKKSDFAPAYYQLSLTEEALDNLEEAIKQMNNAAGLAPDNITYAFNLGRLYQARGKDNDNQVAENIFKAILGVNNKEINTHFNLALLYEKTQRKDEAISEYKNVLDLLPPESQDARQQIEKMISNIEAGISNLSESAGTPQTTSSAETSQ